MAKAKKLPSGSWRVRVSVGKDAKGKYIYRSFTAESKKEAEYMAAEYLHDHKQTERPQNMTLAQAYAGYIESKQNVLSPSTVREYRRSAGRDLQSLMHLQLKDLTQERIQIAINQEALSHSPKSIRNMHGLLSAVLSVYLPSMKINTTMPAKKKTELYIPTNEDIKTLLRCIEGTELEKAVMLAAFGSLRRSEIAALTAEDLNKNTVTISKAMVKDQDKVWRIKQPKTYSGYRTVELPAFVMERIYVSEGRVCDLMPGSITNYFAKALKACGLPRFRFHDLRHYQASILHAMGVPDKYIIERGGWSTDHTLKAIYQHTMSDKRKEVETQICWYFDQLCHDL
ncbi:MAG: site-specific integrase [Oscillospiraceae bacterium]|nr:site-specific integrase [Oscillospiraceae bacterium]